MQDALYLDKHLYFMWLAVLLITTIGVLRRTITTMRGNRISTMATRTTTIRAAQAMCVLFGVVHLKTMQLSLFSNSDNTKLKEGFSLEAVFKAYFSCRNNKRNTINALAFELDY